MDGLDVAVGDFELAGDELWLTPLGAAGRPWQPELRSRLLDVLPPAQTTAGELCELDTAVGQACADAAEWAISEFADGKADLVAQHGQTVFHWVDKSGARGTLQLGQPAWTVQRTGLPVVSDLRSRDIAAGGQGAPLASTLDAMWLAADANGTGSAGQGCRRAALNLGGIANVTVIGSPGEPVTAFDTGPANCLLDAAARRLTDGRQHNDVDGRFALAGTVRSDLLEALLAEPYYELSAPKSTGRELFSGDYVETFTAGLDPVSDVDLMATLTQLTAVTVARACQRYDVSEVVGSGGGVSNPALTAALRRELHPARWSTSDDRGLPADSKEAYLMALLGFLSWQQLPGVLPGATGSAVARVLGRLSPGNAPLRLPEPARAPRRLVVLRHRPISTP